MFESVVVKERVPLVLVDAEMKKLEPISRSGALARKVPEPSLVEILCAVGPVDNLKVNTIMEK